MRDVKKKKCNSTQTYLAVLIYFHVHFDMFNPSDLLFSCVSPLILSTVTCFQSCSGIMLSYIYPCSLISNECYTKS